MLGFARVDGGGATPRTGALNAPAPAPAPFACRRHCSPANELWRIVMDAEVNSFHWTLMHRYHKASDIINEVRRARARAKGSRGAGR
jgi:hypothetical protein